MYAERHRPHGVGVSGAVHRTWAVAEKNDWQFSNPRIDTARIVFIQMPWSSLQSVVETSGCTLGRLCLPEGDRCQR